MVDGGRGGQVDPQNVIGAGNSGLSGGGPPDLVDGGQGRRGGRVVAPPNEIGAGDGGLPAVMAVAAVDEVVAPPTLPAVCGGGGRGLVRDG